MPSSVRVRGCAPHDQRIEVAELDEASGLDEGDPNDLAARYVALRDRMPALTVLGGCCGTDARHVAAICAAWTSGG